MREQLTRLFLYDRWANGLILAKLMDHQVSDEKIVFWMCHILNAQQIWWERIHTRTASVLPQSAYSLSECKIRMEELHNKLLGMVESVPETRFSEIVDYQDTKGDVFKNTIQDILTHVVNHGTHHRAQISSRLRENNIAPPGTDYMFYLREESNSS